MILECADCGMEYNADDDGPFCPRCGSGNYILPGDGETVEMEDDYGYEAE